jgi:hypothetical protein
LENLFVVPVESGEIGWRIRHRILTPYIRTTPKDNLINDFTQLLNEMMRHRSRSVGLSPLLAAILLISITVAAAVVVSGVFFNLASVAGRRPMVVIDQVRLIASPSPDDTYAAAFVIVVKNTGDVPLTTAPAVTLIYPNGVTCTGSVAWAGSGSPGRILSGSAILTGSSCLLLGRSVAVRVSVFFSDGSNQMLTTAVTGAPA